MKLGELFIELGITGDIKPLKQALSGMDAAKIKTKLLTKYLKDLKNATSDGEKALIKKNFAQKISNINTIESLKAGAGLLMQTAKIVTVLGAAAVAFDRLGNSLLKSNQQFINFTQQTGISIDRLNRLAGVAKLSGMNLSAEQVAGDLSSLEQRIFKLGLTGEGSGIFAQLGMNPLGMKSDQFIGALRQRMKGLSEVQKSYILDSLGLSREWLNVLNLTDSEYADLIKQSKELQLTEKERKELAKYTAMQQKNNMRFELAKQRFLKAIMPAVIKIMDATSQIALNLANALGDEKIRTVIKDAALFMTVMATQAALFSSALKPILKGLLGLFGLGKGKGLMGGLLGLLGLNAGAGLFNYGTKKALVGTLGKGAAKGLLRTVGLAIPFVDILMVLWLIYDIIKAFFGKKDKEDQEQPSPIDDSAGYSYRALNSSIVNHFHNNPVPQQEVINNLTYLTDYLLAGTKR